MQPKKGEIIFMSTLQLSITNPCAHARLTGIAPGESSGGGTSFYPIMVIT